MTKLEQLKNMGEAPEWMTEEAYNTLARGYLIGTETPRSAYLRMAEASASRLNRPDLASKFFEIIWKNWLCPATPVASNLGTDRGLPISCFGTVAPDSVDGIFKNYHEIAMLTKHGGGIGAYYGLVRGRGVPIRDNGFSEGVIPWLKVLDSTMLATSQGNVRRGSAAAYLDINHIDIEEFIEMRKPVGDTNRRCLNLNNAVCIDDAFMNDMIAGDAKKRKLWLKILELRAQTGEPYLFFKDNTNNQNPECYKANNLKVLSSQLCLSFDTKVLTKEYGAIEIGNLVNKTVTIFDGQNWVSNSSFSKTGENQEVLKIKLRDGSEFVCTPYHKLYDMDNNLVVAKDVKIGTKLKTHNQTFSFGTKKEQGAYLKGFLIAEGTSEKKTGKPILWLYEPKEPCKERLLKSLKEIDLDDDIDSRRSDLITEPSITEYDNNLRRTLNGLNARKKSLYKFCSDYKKFLPQDIYTWTKESQLDFIAGLFDGDGTVINSGYSKCYQIVSIHKSFLEELQELLKSFGVFCCLSKMRGAATVNFNDDYGEYETKPAYRITISNISARNLASLVKFERLISFANETGYDRLPTFNEVVGIEKMEEKIDVYCTTVPTTNMFALANGLMVGNCNEIMLHSDEDHTYVCCLSSMNLARWEEWKDTNAVQLAIYFLDGVMEEFIQKAKHIPGFEKAVRFSEKSRALGLGVLGWHTLLQSKLLPFDSFDAMMLNAKVFKHIREQAEITTAQLAKEYGEPEWCKGFNRRNTHLLAVAPTASNSIISGGVSAGIEPLAANYFAKKSAKGTFITKNPYLKRILEEMGINNTDTWSQINKDRGSVINLNLPENIKQVFLTAKEINQFALIKQAAQRQKFIDQGQSLNLFFASNASPKYINEVHIEAWKSGLKGLYYFRTESVIRGDLASRSKEECASCEG